MNRYTQTSLASAARIFSLTLIFTVTGINQSTAETFRWGDSTTSIQQHGGNHQSQSRVTRFEDGQQIITKDGRNTDITIQREGQPTLPRINVEQRFAEDNDRFEEPNFEQRFSRPDTFGSGVPPRTSPESSQLQIFFLLHLMERLRGHFAP